MHRKATGVATAALGQPGLPAPSRRTSHLRISTRLTANGKVQRPLKALLAELVVASASLTNLLCYGRYSMLTSRTPVLFSVAEAKFIASNVMPVAC